MDFGLGGGPQCANTCDANADPTGCDPRELCNPEAQVDDPEAPSPGSCVPSQECDIDSAAVCGDGSTCAVVQNITLCAPAGTAQTGAPCEIFPDTEDLACRPGLTCIAGTCSMPCGPDNSCDEGARCVDFTDQLEGQEFTFCYAGCNIFSQTGCGAGQTCAWTNTAPNAGENAEQAMGVCVDSPNGMGVQNEPCTQSEESYWGTCDHSLCLPLSEGDDPTCLGFCDDVDQSDCINGSVCVRDALAVNLGLCLGECAFWPAEGAEPTCAEGEVCRFAFIGADANGPTAAGLCSPSAQTDNTGEECTVTNEATGDNSCVQGHICTAIVANAPPVCVKICEQGEGVANGCPPGFSCIDVFEDPNIGACLER